MYCIKVLGKDVYTEKGDVIYTTQRYLSAESFNDWGGRGCNKLVPVLRGDGTKIASPGDLLDQLPGEMNRVRGKLADHAGHHVVLSPEGVVFVPSPGTESSYPRPPQSLEHSADTLTALSLSV